MTNVNRATALTLAAILCITLLYLPGFLPAGPDHEGSPAKVGGGVFRSISYLDGGELSACDGIPNGRNATAHSNHGASVTDTNGTRHGCGVKRFDRKLPYHYITDGGTSSTSWHVAH